MKLKLIPMFVLTAFLCLVGVCSAHAEMDQIQKTNIPFDFYVSGQKMPAGTYNVRLDPESMIAKLSDNSGHAVYLMGIPAGDNNGEPMLVFDRVGDSYFLQEVKGDDIVVAFPQDKPANVEAKVNATTPVQGD